MIQRITPQNAHAYYMSWRGGEQQVSFSLKGEWWAYVSGGITVGIVSTQRMGRFTRVKTLLVEPHHRRKGIGAALVAHVSTGPCTAFATLLSERIFARNGYMTLSINRRNIAYMKKST